MADNKITRSLQKWTIPLFTINACLISLCSVGALSCFNASSRMTEKQFGFTSKQTSLIMVGDEISGFASLIFGYLGGKFHKPRFLGVMVILMGLSCITLTIPYYVSAASRDTTDIISGNVTTSTNLTKLPDIVCRTTAPVSMKVITPVNQASTIRICFIYLYWKNISGCFLWNNSDHAICLLE